MSYRIIYSFLALFFISCEELEVDSDNPFEASEEDQIPEIINWNHNVNGSDVDIDWEGNKYAFEFRYMLETEDYTYPSPYFDWSEWTSDTSVTLTNLDEGHYTFYVKSRFDNKEEQEPYKSTDFEIDAIEGCAVRIYPMYQEITPESDFDLFVYVEECHDLMLMELKLDYNQDELEVSDITTEEIMPENTDLFETMYWENGDITIISGLLNGYSIQDLVNIQNGTTAVAKIRFHAKSQATWSQIIVDEGSSKLRNMNYENMEFHGVGGTIEVVE
jgi:hypothetical protein